MLYITSVLDTLLLNEAQINHYKVFNANMKIKQYKLGFWKYKVGGSKRVGGDVTLCS